MLFNNFGQFCVFLTLLISYTEQHKKTISGNILNEAFNHQVVNISENDFFILQLPGNISTGYSWHITKIDSNLIKQKGDIEYQQHVYGKGKPGIFIFTFDIIDHGRSELKLCYAKSWELDSPIDSFSIIICRTRDRF